MVRFLNNFGEVSPAGNGNPVGDLVPGCGADEAAPCASIFKALFGASWQGRHEICSYDPDQTSGILPGTRIATNLGWRPVEAVTAGDFVATFDSGWQPVMAVSREYIPPAYFDSVLTFAQGVLGNTRPMAALPSQPVLIESDIAEVLFGDPFALVPAQALADIEGVSLHEQTAPTESVRVHLEHDELIFAEGGALMLAFSQVPGAVTHGFLNPASVARYRVMRGPLLTYLTDAFTGKVPSRRAGALTF